MAVIVTHTLVSLELEQGAALPPASWVKNRRVVS
jgi:hypothetical protein